MEALCACAEDRISQRQVAHAEPFFPFGFSRVSSRCYATERASGTPARRGSERGEMKGRKKKAAAEVRALDEGYARWKANIPLLYDWFTNHSLAWPSRCCGYSIFLPALSPFCLLFLCFSVRLGFGSDDGGFRGFRVLVLVMFLVFLLHSLWKSSVLARLGF